MKSKHYIIILIVILILAGAWWWTSKNKAKDTQAPVQNNEQTQNNQDDSSEEVVAPPATNILASTDSIVVTDQGANSSSVTVDNINISKPSFVTIIIPGAAGKADQIIGTSGLLTAGAKQDFEVNLKPGIKLNANTDYTAQIYMDDGDKKFDITKDTKISGPNSTTTFSAE